MRWSELPLEQILTRLAAAGIDPDWLILDARDVPELKPAFRRLSQMTWEERLRVALVWFGDERHPQPKVRSAWRPPGRPTPDWVLPPLEADEEPEAKRGAKKLGISEREFWWIVERRLEKGDRASREWLARQTRRREDLTYVPRDRLAPLVDWIDAHPEAARQALSLRRIPPEFPAGKLGPVPSAS